MSGARLRRAGCAAGLGILAVAVSAVYRPSTTVIRRWVGGQVVGLAARCRRSGDR